MPASPRPLPESWLATSSRAAAAPTAFFIHGCIHRAVPRARCILHTPLPYATALTIVEGGRLAWASQNALQGIHVERDVDEARPRNPIERFAYRTLDTDAVDLAHREDPNARFV